MVLRRTDQPGSRKALSVRVSHRFAADSARFDEDNLVSHAGLVPLLGLAAQTRLPQIVAEKVSITTLRIKSGAANPVPKLVAVIAEMCAGADSIDDLDVLRAGGMPILFDDVYAPSTLGCCCGSSASGTSASARVGNVVPGQYRSSTLIVDHWFSASALSKLSPVLPVDGATPASTRRWVNRSAVYLSQAFAEAATRLDIRQSVG